ncbi:DEAD/DEAH box helicase [Luteimonas saliphila]|uniref:DEAD/DEAH box helicase n=1 Tax=Luteimonas saliphila TaxID=2804919 RepID=UPI00192DF2D1|nr:DEAD/DEAH box helicase [Luteimonas saliphila]
MSADAPAVHFADFGLPPPLMQALADVGYESPSPIQAATIPPLLQGRDVLGQAQTGTGKTAAFALPALARLDPAARKPQVLVLAPTRELAIQVAEAFQKYATHLPGFHVLPIYGGQAYGVQLSALKRGVHVIVGTPGRVIDHLDRGSLDLSELRTLILDEADEMLRMGFIDDVEAVLKKTPATRQVALFSATMPSQIKRIAQTYLKDPVEIAIKSQTTTAANIRQRVWMVSGTNKLDALTRILEAEPFDAMIVFARTKLGTAELAEKLAARGFAAAAINGDLDQKQREKTIQSLKDGRIDILVATDVAARGLDVERISHVLNYDIPYDTESYVHRIGRTGRAGRSGEAILFAAPRERGMLGAIERATRQKIEAMQLPSVETVNERRVAKFLDRVTGALESPDLAMFRDLVERYEREHNVPAVEIAAALAKIVQGDTPLLLPASADKPRPHRDEGRGPRERMERREAAPGQAYPRREATSPAPAHPRREAAPAAQPRREPAREERSVRNAAEAAFEAEPAVPSRTPRERPERAARSGTDTGFAMETFRIEVGHAHGVQPGNIVGAIANEAELESRYIGRIDIRDDHSLVDLPEGMPREILELLKKVWVSGQQLKIRRADDDSRAAPRRRPGGTAPGKPAGPRKGKSPHRGR